MIKLSLFFIEESNLIILFLKQNKINNINYVYSVCLLKYTKNLIILIKKSKILIFFNRKKIRFQVISIKRDKSIPINIIIKIYSPI